MPKFINAQNTRRKSPIKAIWGVFGNVLMAEWVHRIGISYASSPLVTSNTRAAQVSEHSLGDPYRITIFAF